MRLVLDTAPYHHKRNIGSLQRLAKKDLIKMMVDEEVDEKNAVYRFTIGSLPEW